VGAEREGLPGAVVAACDEVAHIPIAFESLNAATAASVAMYETTRCSVPRPA
jgi:RNA methyltransferase, TrmH family